MAAVQQNGLALRHVPDDLKNNESIVMAAVQQNNVALWDVPHDLRDKIDQAASDFGISVHAYARAMLNPMLVQVQASKASSHGVSSVALYSIAGEELATVVLEEADNIRTFREKIADQVSPPHGPASMVLMMPGGQRLRDVDSHEPLSQLLAARAP